MQTLILICIYERQTKRQTNRQGGQGKHSVFMARHLSEPFPSPVSYLHAKDRSFWKSSPRHVSSKFADVQTSPVVQQAAGNESFKSPLN